MIELRKDFQQEVINDLTDAKRTLVRHYDILISEEVEQKYINAVKALNEVIEYEKQILDEIA
tara:strand:- start:369 stop:554 length:186 start_codon:yes stop_codon:yes gene_type:complete